MDIKKEMKNYPKVVLKGVKKLQLWVLAEGSAAATVDRVSKKLNTIYNWYSNWNYYALFSINESHNKKEKVNVKT